MLQYVRTHSSVLTLVALILGALLSPWFHKHPGTRSEITAAEFERHLQVYRSVPLVASVPMGNPGNPVRPGGRVSMSVSEAELLMPDALAAKMYGCQFGGAMAPRFEGWMRTQADSESVRDGILTLKGDLYRCSPKGAATLAARRASVQVSLNSRTSGGVVIGRLQAWASYPDFLAQAFITLLLMLFIPTLALSVLRSIVDSAGSFRRLRFPFLYFVVTSVVAAGLGTAVVRLAAGASGQNAVWGQDLAGIAERAGSTAEAPEKVPYEPHPVLSIISSIIPRNPLGALTDPAGNAGLQLAFVCVLAGLLMALLDEDTRLKLSAFFNRSLAIVVHDNEYRNLAFSDLLDAVTPFGMFFVTLSVGATITLQGLDLLWQLVMVILLGLVAQAAVLLIWLFWRRDARAWFSEVAIPALPALLVAFTTASSYAALAALNKVEGIHRDPLRRGIIDLGTVLNKNGTAVYISTAAAFTLAAQSITGAHLWGVIPFAALAAIATAGLPFAAVIGLRMVLLSVGFPGSLAWLILPIDPLIDRFVTVLNVLSNLILCSDAKADDEQAPDLVSSAAEA